MRQDVSDVDASEVVAHVDHESVLVPTDVEDRPTGTQEARGGKVLAKLMWRPVVATLQDPIPGIERRLRVRMPLPEMAQRLPRDDPQALLPNPVTVSVIAVTNLVMSIFASKVPAMRSAIAAPRALC
jgi:hypothetical protein